MRDRARPRADLRTAVWRAAALGFTLLSGVAATALMAEAAFAAGFGAWDVVCVVLIFFTTLWLAWGAAQSLVGLAPGRRPAPTDLPHPDAPTVILLPICNEDARAAAARLAAMEASVRAAGVTVDFAVLSDTRDGDALILERQAFAPLCAHRPDRLRVYYRNRTENWGRKAGNIEDFIRNSGGAYEFAVILDADSLMEGETIGHLIARMQAAPDIGLLQTLPKIIGATSWFGRAMQFAASFYSPVFARGLQRMQGPTGPFWGHNAIVRVKALAESCALPELSGRPPFGGSILSHDYVEAALLARAGWRVEVDPAIPGSFEEGPDNLVAYARRDRRWCQGNLQHLRIVGAPGLTAWSRFVFVQGIASYIVPLFWAGFLLSSMAALVAAPPPDYFPEPYQLFPVFPDRNTREIVALAIGIVGLLLLPKVGILAAAIASDRTKGFGGAARTTASVLAETLLSSLIAPIMLMYQSRAVIEVLSGKDGGWPATMRGEGRLSLSEGRAAAGWISLSGLAALCVVAWLGRDLLFWLLPVTLPMIAAPLLIAATSRPAPRGLFTAPDEIAPSPVIAAYRTALGTGTAQAAPAEKEARVA
ncbi:membrane glycosyltransferase [Palleronia marisminoris]|uniref:Glucans biosynthesis glucosyltransferase H n=1 Tax=Palleronia marisminoris TaxID=315423 RepID=A0A1Y5SQ23_9RHOB|nr:glucans biosynthesis glucosyltransferase MdoH [Palleronia marisminoris]SFG86349.1 membrane glycosyltransferase [Palleronia marisminoris]SLN42748.1 Glucans biosynthesis glucosyltransferase H [Palleronia marisminoris]